MNSGRLLRVQPTQGTSHAAIVCLSFHHAEIVQNPNAWDRFIARLRGTVIGWLQPALTARTQMPDSIQAYDVGSIQTQRFESRVT